MANDSPEGGAVLQRILAEQEQIRIANRVEYMYIVHLNSGEAIFAQFNPTELHEKLSAVWKGFERQGGTSSPLEWERTENLQLSFELTFNKQAYSTELGHQEIERSRKFLLASMYPMAEGGEDEADASPSPLLFVWPNLYSLKCQLVSVDITHTIFGKDGSMQMAVCSVELLAFRDDLITFEHVYQHGTKVEAAPW